MTVNGKRKIRVLIADDENAITRIYSIGLQHYFAPPDNPAVVAVEKEIFGDSEDKRPSVDITVCQQGDEAVVLARNAVEAGNPFDVIVLDIRMPPGISGIEAARQIRAIDETVAILFVSGHADYTLEKLKDSMPTESALGLIEKPIQLAHLAAKIKKAAA